MTDDWDPKPHERQYFLHATTGDKGYLVRRGGELHIKLDRPNDPSTKVYRQTDWSPLTTNYPMASSQRGMVAYEADRSLCKTIGLHHVSRAEWSSLSESERLRWMHRGPRGNKRREKLWKKVMEALEEDS